LPTLIRQGCKRCYLPSPGTCWRGIGNIAVKRAKCRQLVRSGLRPPSSAQSFAVAPLVAVVDLVAVVGARRKAAPDPIGLNRHRRLPARQ
jgi:hypothetical protein